MSSEFASGRRAGSSRLPAEARPAWRPFLATYASDLIAGDLAGAAARWRLPSVLLSAYGVVSFSRVADVQRHLAGLWLRYRDVGAAALRPVLIDAHPLSPGLFTVEVEWALINRRGAVLGSEYTRQIVRRGDDGQLGIELMLTVHAHCLTAGPIGQPET